VFQIIRQQRIPKFITQSRRFRLAAKDRDLQLLSVCEQTSFQQLLLYRAEFLPVLTGTFQSLLSGGGSRADLLAGRLTGRQAGWLRFAASGMFAASLCLVSTGDVKISLNGGPQEAGWIACHATIAG
jgi:hypothetical protein